MSAAYQSTPGRADQPNRLPSSPLTESAKTPAKSQPDMKLANNWPTRRLDDTAGSRLVGSRVLMQVAGSRPLQATYKPHGTPSSNKMSAVATHIDDLCHIYVHDLEGLLCNMADL